MRFESDSMVCLARVQNHPIFPRDALTLDSLFEGQSCCKFVLGRREYFAVDRELDKWGINGRFLFSFTEFCPQTGKSCVWNSDLLLTVPRLFGRGISGNGNLKICGLHET